MKKNFWFLTAGVAIILICLGYYLINVGRSGTTDPSKKSHPPYGQSITFSGRSVCLQHKDQKGPQTAECGMGFSNGTTTYQSDLEEYTGKLSVLDIGSGE